MLLCYYVNLCDAKFKKIETSILSMIHSFLFSGPIHFDYFLPYQNLDLDDTTILKALKLNILKFSYEIDEGSKTLCHCLS